jgi:hypothetical protein
MVGDRSRPLDYCKAFDERSRNGEPEDGHNVTGRQRVPFWLDAKEATGTSFYIGLRPQVQLPSVAHFRRLVAILVEEFLSHHTSLTNIKTSFVN